MWSPGGAGLAGTRTGRRKCKPEHEDETMNILRTILRNASPLVLPVLLLFLHAGPAASEVEAQIALGAQGSWGSSADFGIGGRALFNIPGNNLEAVGSVDVFFPDGDVNWLDANANVFYHFHLTDSPSVLPYLGGGLNLAHLSNDASATEAGLNLGGGVRFPGGGITPFVELRGVISDADQLVISGGILFGQTSY